MTQTTSDDQGKAGGGSLPGTFSYPMPTPAALPPDRSGWVVDPRRAALLVLNVQNHFLRVLQERSAPAAELVGTVALLVEAARKAGIPVLYAVAVDGHERAVRETAFGHPRLPAAGGSRDVVAAVRPMVGDSVLVAKRISAFAGTRLRPRLDELERDQPVIVGLFARTQVMLTAADAWTQDLEPFVVADAVADTTPGDHRMAVDWIAATCGAVRSARGVADVFGSTGPWPG
ncbi:isochorismatase family protein [Streptomyces sp. NPDC090106]|uniref:isochorismatase family protein n=1 Tax=Streptomyces sp. NPDC090106 TaxID=3365946 RepID=UPI003807E9EF